MLEIMKVKQNTLNFDRSIDRVFDRINFINENGEEFYTRRDKRKNKKII